MGLQSDIAEEAERESWISGFKEIVQKHGFKTKTPERSIDVHDFFENLLSELRYLRLIQAAPEMLEIMKKHLHESGCDGDLCSRAWHEEFRTIIRKVEQGE